MEYLTTDEKKTTVTLRAAVLNADVSLVGTLLTKEEEVKKIGEKDDSGSTVLMLASMNINKKPQDYSEIIRMLIDKGASLEDEDMYGNTALLITVLYNCPQIMQTLLDNGAVLDHKNHQNVTAYEKAHISNASDVIPVLTEHKLEHESYEQRKKEVVLHMLPTQGFFLPKELLNIVNEYAAPTSKLKKT